MKGTGESSVILDTGKKWKPFICYAAGHTLLFICRAAGHTLLRLQFQVVFCLQMILTTYDEDRENFICWICGE